MRDDCPCRYTGAKTLRLLLHVLDQRRALDPFGKAREIFDFSGNGELAAGLMPFENERLQIGSGRVDCGGVPGTT